MPLRRHVTKTRILLLLIFGLAVTSCHGKSLHQEEYETKTADPNSNKSDSNSKALKLAAQCFMLGVGVLLLLIAVRYRVQQCQRKKSQAAAQNAPVIIAIPPGSASHPECGSDLQPTSGVDIKWVPIYEPPPSYHEATGSPNAT